MNYRLQVVSLMSFKIFSPALFVVFFIVQSSVITMSQQHSLSKSTYLDPQALTSDTPVPRPVINPAVPFIDGLFPADIL